MYAPRTGPGHEHMPPAPQWQYPIPPAHPQSLPPTGGPYYAPSGQPPPSSLPPIGEHRPAAHHLPPGPPPPHYAHPPPHDPRYPYPYPPPQHPYAQPPHQPAPRQRTAIACRYCRRRKIRCSGFDSAEDGRCSNCARFSQECVFTPVSAQAQAFVPAHAVYRGGAQPTQLYGAYGQPLPPASATHDPYGRGPPPPHHPGYPPPYGHGPPAPYATPPYDERAHSNGSRKRAHDEPHTPTLPPPNPGIAAAMPRSAYPEQDLGYRYPDPTAAGPAAQSPYAAGPPPPAAAAPPPHPAGPYYAQQPLPRRVSPVLASPYSSTADGHRLSQSPGTSNLPPPTTPGLDGPVPYSAADYRTAAQAAAAAATNTSDYRAPATSAKYRSPTPASAGVTKTSAPAKSERSPPRTATPISATSNPNSAGPTSGANGASNGTRPGLAISSIVSGDGLSPGGGGRSTTDSAMLNKLK